MFCSQFVYPGPKKPLDVRQVDGQFEVFLQVEKTVKQNLAQLLSTENSAVATESLIAGAIAMALCYIARIQRTKPTGVKVCLLKYPINIINIEKVNLKAKCKDSSSLG